MERIVHFIKHRLYLLIALVLASCALEVSDGPTEESGTGESPPDDTFAVAEQPLTAADVAWWRGLTQIERNQAILDRAYRDIGIDVKMQCKPWVQRVVPDASRGVATVPATSPDPAGWYWQMNAYAIRYYGNIRYVKPGWIVQMNLKKTDGTITPHTAIVVGVSSSGVNWIDSNFYSKTQPNVVTVHFMTFTDFERITYINGQYKYSLYYIGGG